MIRRISRLPAEQYHEISDRYLCHLSEQLDELGENIKDFNCDYSSGILNFNLNKYRYVLNKQPPNRQIWWSSPISGPLRFDYDGKVWFNKHNQLLSELLHREWNSLAMQNAPLSKFKEPINK
eukprot:NODE_288_length_11703_cov_0.386591.p8 type:complete len:122 gc:universal NODE_288_length_11703_cov_0.386591:5079-4714(-)